MEEFIVAEEGIPYNIGCEGATIAYYGSEIEFHYEIVPPHGDEIFSAKLPLLNVNLPFWMYGRNLIFLDAYYMLAETVEKGTWDPITSRNNFVSRNRCFMLRNVYYKLYLIKDVLQMI